MFSGWPGGFWDLFCCTPLQEIALFLHSLLRSGCAAWAMTGKHFLLQPCNLWGNDQPAKPHFYDTTLAGYDKTNWGYDGFLCGERLPGFSPYKCPLLSRCKLKNFGADLILVFIFEWGRALLFYSSSHSNTELMELLILRLIHILTGAFWAGATLYLVLFVLPAVKALGPEGAKFMGQLMKTRQLPVVMNVISGLNILTGLRLLMVVSNNFKSEWFASHYGISISIGMVAALGAWTIGLMVSRPTAARMNQLGAQIAAAGGPPTPEQGQQLGALRAKMSRSLNIMAWHLAAALAFMAMAKYL